MIDNQTPQLSDRELLVRIDTKLDGVIEDKKDHEARLRRIEESYATSAALKLVEKQATDTSEQAVSKKQLWTGLGAVFAAAGSAFPIIQWIISR